MNEKNNKEKNKILALIILIVTLTVTTTGATYAFFALSAVNNNSIIGTSATVNGVLDIARILPGTVTNASLGIVSWNDSTKVMVPQYSSYNNKNALGQAVSKGCVDANKNVVCEVYRVTFRNANTIDGAADPNAASLRITPKITSFSITSGTTSMSNLKWYVIRKPSSATDTSTSHPGTATGTYSYPTSFTNTYGNSKNTSANLGDPLIVPSGNFGYWDIVVWIEETGNDQYNVDGSSSFVGSVETQMIDSNGNNIGGITSTFTG